MISPIRITIKGYPRNESEDLDTRSLIPIKININDYPIFHYFGPDNPLLFNISYSYSASPKMKLNVKSDHPAVSKLFAMANSAKARFIIRGDFDHIVFGLDNRLKATSNYFIRNGFADSSRALVPNVLLKVLISAGKASSTFEVESKIVDCYQIKSNLLRDWDDIALSEMDIVDNDGIAGSIVE